MFLFSVFTGICYCDMRNLTEKNVVRDHEGNLWIETRRQKTGTPENVRLLDIAIEIMKKYRGAVSYTHLDVYKRQGHIQTYKTFRHEKLYNGCKYRLQHIL